MPEQRCVACGKPIHLINWDKARGVIGMTHAWVHTSRWVRHKPIPAEYLKKEATR